ncbi:hypothetical protein ACHAXT_001540 [Thalassiosira profunda]
MATAFPRGKRRPPPSAAPASTSSSERPSKKAKDASDANASAAKAHAAKDDFLFGSSALLADKPKQHKPPAPHSVAAPSLSNLPLGGGGVLPPTTTATGKRLPPKIEPLSFSKYAKGTKVLGVIREVSAEYAVVSLGCRLNGFVRRDAFNNNNGEEGNAGLAGTGANNSAKSPPLTKVLPPPGSLFAFYVLSTESEDVSKRQQRKQAAASGTPAAAKKRRIELSPWPREVNSGLRGAAGGFLAPASGRRANGEAECVDGSPMVVRGTIASIEDHGCLVDLGGVLGDRRAFLRFDAIEGGYALEDDDEDSDGEDSEEEEEEGGDKMDVDESNGVPAASAPKRPLNVGRAFDFALLPSHLSPSSNNAIVQLSLPSHAALTALRTPPAAMPSLSSLQPGMLTQVNVEAHARNGLCVSFHEGVYRGSLDEDHLGGHKGAEMGTTKKKDGNDVWWRGVFKGRHSKFVARIIAVDAATKVVRFSLNPHVLGLDASLARAPRPVGTVVEHARVIRVDPGLGALLALPGPDATEDEEGEEGDEEEGGVGEAVRAREARLVALDQSLGNGLLSVPEYRAASRVETAYVHISKSMDVPADATDASKKGGHHHQRARTPESLFARHFAVNNRIKALRVLGNGSLLDGVASCAMAPSIVKAHVLTHADVVPGKLYERVPVVRLLDGGGILVDLGCGVRGVVPASHLFDKASHGSLDGGDAAADGYRQKIRAAKYKVGNSISVRCLTVDPDKRTCVLTAKKALVATADLDPIIDYASIQAGRVAAGYISKVDANGLTVTFCNNVHGRVSSRSLARELGVEDCWVNYSVGDVVLARAVACERRRNRNYTAEDGEEHKYYYRLTLSLKTAVDEAPEGAAAAPNADGAPALAAGAIVPPKRMKVVQLVDGLQRDDGTWRPGCAVVSVKSKCFAGAFDSDIVECRLPYDQLLDSHADRGLSSPPAELDAVAREVLTVGKRIDAAAAVLAVPYHYGGSDALPVVSLKPSLVATVRAQQAQQESPAGQDDPPIVCPAPKTHLFVGRHVRGYVARVDPRFGAFVRFLDGLSGLVPKTKKGCELGLYDTIVCRVTALDVTSSPPKILLKRVTEGDIAKRRRKGELQGQGATGGASPIRVGDAVGDVQVTDVNFARAKVRLLDRDTSKIRARIHVTLAAPLDKKPKLSKKERQWMEERKIGRSHPFYGWKVGDVLTNVRCAAIDERDGAAYVELTNVAGPLPSLVGDPAHLPPGAIVSAIVTSVSTAPSPHGVWVQVCPGVAGFVPALELSADPGTLNDLEARYEVGARLTCRVVEEKASGGGERRPSLLRRRQKPRGPLPTGDGEDRTAAGEEHRAVELSALLASQEGGDAPPAAVRPTKPRRGDLVAGRINAKLRTVGAPSLMVTLRGGFAGRCCVTELADADGWENVPLGNAVVASAKGANEETPRRVVSDSDADRDRDGEDSDGETDERDIAQNNDYPDGKYVQCRVLGNAAGRSKGTVELSLRESRCAEGGSLDDDAAPGPNDMVHAYVVSTTKKGCFVRLSRTVEGRVILKELSDDFIPNPSAQFPPGRLVVGKVKAIKAPSDRKRGPRPQVTTVDLDLRESVLLSSGPRVAFDDIEEHATYTGVVTRVETYGAFVRIDNSDVTGLAHVSECADHFVKDLPSLYNPGDFVKLIVIKVDKEQNRLGFSLKASNFADDSDDDDSSSTSSSDGSASSASAGEMEQDGMGGDIDSEDEDFASKLAEKMEAGGEDVDVDDDKSTDGSESSSDGSGSESESSDSEEEAGEGKPADKEDEQPQAMETDVGFDWGGTAPSKSAKASKLAESSSDESSSDSSDEESEEDADSGFKSSHRSRKKAAAKRREEEETSRREAALADGTADDAPETSADFERLIASSPNSSEIWIRYMAFHLSLADIDSARNVANRAFERIEFREEGEKLNVWTALLTLELKYGTGKSLHETVDRACQQNNPKQVYLRVCELLDKEVDAASGSGDLDTATERADEMFAKMCKKFSSKKSVWLAHFRYLLKGSRHEEAHALLKRSLQSLPTYKHVEVMSKFAQMEFEMGSPERGRTIFGALLEKHPKRMDLLFVHIDKEVKNGDVAKARALFDSVVHPVSQERKFKFSDKQMKSLFKKWYKMEEKHGDDESQERVKDEARAFVAKAS